MNASQNVKTIITKQYKTKSSAPIIWGGIGFLMGIPAILCATVCAAVVAGAASVPAAMAQDPTVAMTASDREAAMAASATGAAASVLPLAILILTWLAGFILCFFAKSKYSNVTGILTILCSIGLGAVSIPFLDAPGFIAAILYVISGGLAISNASRPAE